MKRKTAVLVVNLGSPEAPTPAAVRRYLKEFLWDRRVVNLPRPLWWLILHGAVLPFRPRRSAHAYQTIWTEQGSPLTVYTAVLTEKLAQRLSADEHLIVEMAMRYGQPAIAEKLATYQVQGVERLIVLPLYPQFSSTTTAAVFDAVTAFYEKAFYIPDLCLISDYHDDPRYLDAIADRIRQAWAQQGRGQRLLFSFHGLPAVLSEWGDPYARQCQRTATLIAERLALASDDWQLVFQSRFGRAEWLKPYCVETLQALPNQGITDIDIICPGFAVDCLETLEEIAITNREVFLQAGGRHYRYIPALNASDEHVTFLSGVLAAQGIGV